MHKTFLRLSLIFLCATTNAGNLPPPPPPPHTVTPGNSEIAHFVHLHSVLKSYSRADLIAEINACHERHRDDEIPVKPIPPQDIPDEPSYSDTYIYSAKGRAVEFFDGHGVMLNSVNCQLGKGHQSFVKIRTFRGHCTLNPKSKVAVGNCDGDTPVKFAPSDKPRRKSSGTKLVLGRKCDIYTTGIPNHPSRLDGTICLSSEGTFVGYPMSGLIRGVKLSLESIDFDVQAKTAIFDMPVSASLFEVPPDYKIHSPKAKRKRGNDDEDESENEGKD